MKKLNLKKQGTGVNSELDTSRSKASNLSPKKSGKLASSRSKKGAVSFNNES
jgi:hypothetical protein